jgi:hypothetical protein
MSQLIQIIYISRSTFTRSAKSSGIEPNVGRILQKSRSNNQKNGLVGVLYFGDDCFFQCLEGEQQAVETLFAKLEQDTRHKDIKIISRRNIDALTFTEWAMKYVPLDNEMNQLLKKFGYDKFDPYIFNDNMTEVVMRLLYAASDPGRADTGSKSAQQKVGLSPAIIISIAVAAIAIIAVYGAIKS